MRIFAKCFKRKTSKLPLKRFSQALMTLSKNFLTSPSLGATPKKKSNAEVPARIF